MIKGKIRNAKGISLISLVITVTALVILTNVIIYNVKDNLKVGKLKEMQNDIANLRDKVSSYYAQNGKIPARMRYTNIDHIKAAGVISQTIDTGDFLIIDLSALENLTLNYGEDFEKVKSLESLTDDEAKEYTDIYIINETSHNIFYVAGITMDEESFYTDYTSDDVDLKTVDLKYVEGIKIPEGFYYVEGTKYTGIVIKSNDNTKEYKWIQKNDVITEIPNDVDIDTSQKKNFIKSVNAYQGYYKSTNSNEVIYLDVEKWSPIYDKEGIYKDKNEDIAYIPQNFQVSELPGENTIDEGLVIKGPDGSEFVWVPIADINIMATKILGTDSNGRENYQGKLYDFSEMTSTEMTNYGQGTTSNREPALLSIYDTDTTNYNTIGMTESGLQSEYNAMIESVKKYGGFYIGRYETSISGDAVASKAGVSPMGAEASSGNTWYGMYQKQKEYVSKNSLTSVSSSMIWGSQYDAMLNWALTGNDKEKVTANANGNHSGSVVNTGETTTDKINNIYDLEGNLYEWSLEANATSERVIRGRWIPG